MQNPSEQLKNIPLSMLIPDLLKQFNKPTLLAQRNITLTKSDMDAISKSLTDDADLLDIVPSLTNALADIVQESVDFLHDKFGLSFEQSLRTTDISQVAAWETTADFLEIANHKSNAELRISAGTSLMVFLRDLRFANYLLTVIDVDDNTDDVDAMIAKRALSHTLKVAIDSENWLEMIKKWLSQND